MPEKSVTLKHYKIAQQYSVVNIIIVTASADTAGSY